MSVDSEPCNTAWMNSLGGLNYPLLSDFWPHGAVSEKYGILRAEGISERTVIVIDKEGIIGYIDVHNIADAPDPEEALKALRALS